MIYRDPMMVLLLLDCWLRSTTTMIRLMLAMNHFDLVQSMMLWMIRLSMMVNLLEVGERMVLYPIFACHVCVERRFSVLTVQGIHRD